MRLRVNDSPSTAIRLMLPTVSEAQTATEPDEDVLSASIDIPVNAPHIR